MLLLAYLYWKKPKQKYVKWAFALQFLFFALRAPVVAGDMWNYIRYLDGERNFYNYDSRELEVGFQLYRQILSSLHIGRFGCMLINSFLMCSPVYLLIKKYSNNPPLSLALATVFGLYVLYFCALRQVLGLSVLFMCMLYVLEDKHKINNKRKFFVYILGTFIGYTFHTSIIIYSILFAISFFLRHIMTKKILIVGIALSALMGVVLERFNIGQAFDFLLNLNFSATERIQGYLEIEETNEITSVIHTLRPSILAIIAFYFIDKEKETHWFTIIYFLGVVLCNLFISVPMVNRLTQGMTVFGLIVFTWIFNKQYATIYKHRRMVNAICFVVFLYFSQSMVKDNLYSNIDLTSSSRMHPYQFIWENYSQHPSIKYYGN